MCGIAGMVGPSANADSLRRIIGQQQHRGPDASAIYLNPAQTAGLGHNRLSIVDLSAAGVQPMSDPARRRWLSFNGEIYNYLELKAELSSYPFRSGTDSEVILAAYERWGLECLDHFLGMFAFILWDEDEQRLFAARDRFGVKPLFHHASADGTLLLASEIHALHAAGVAPRPNEQSWATYLAYGLSDHSEQTFWQGIQSLPAGHALTWQRGQTRIWSWYDLAARVGTEYDTRPVEVVKEEYRSLLQDSVRLRFRADVPVGINLSGGLDSSTLLGLVDTVQGHDSDVKAFTFITGDPQYDELPWVQQMLQHTRHESVVCALTAAEVPDLAESVQLHEDEPFGGLPTLAYARLFEEARARDVVVLLDGQGMDEQWAGYDYYQHALDGPATFIVQGTRDQPVRPACLEASFRALARPLVLPTPFPDPLRNVQYRDVRYTKIPRALRFNDRVAMRSSTELREPFLDHRVFELAFRQSADRKVVAGTRKWLLRQVASELLPQGLVEAPKRPVQTPQREWLRGPLRDWTEQWIETALRAHPEWLDATAVRAEWQRYCQGAGDNSYYVWQWVSIGMETLSAARARQSESVLAEELVKAQN